MIAAWAWARFQLRHRLRMMVVLGALAGVAGAVTLTAVAGTRRTATVWDRHRDLTLAADASVGPDFDPAFFVPGVLDPYYEIDGVEEYSEALLLAMRPVGSGFFWLFDRSAIAAVDDRLGTELNRPRIVEGRVFDHRRDDEVVLSEEYAAAIGAEVGDVVHFESWSRAAVRRAFASNFNIDDQPDGPEVALTVVGIAREFAPAVSEQQVPGTAYFTAAFTRRWQDEIGAGYLAGIVSLEDGAAGYESFRNAALEVSDQVGAGLRVEQEGAGEAAEVTGGIDAQVMALLVFAAVVGAAGSVVVFAALSRQVSFARDEQTALRAIGMTRTERIVAVAMLGIPTACVAAASAAAMAFGASAVLPIATPGRIEPDPGLRADPVVLVVGALAVMVVVLLMGGVAGASLTRVPLTDRSRAVRPGVGVTVARLLPGPPAASIGIRHALDRGRGDRVLPTRSTLIGCTVGVLGIAAALMFGASLNHLVSTPRLYGWAADEAFWPAVNTDEPERLADEWQRLAKQMETDPDIAEEATVIATELVVDGQTTPAVVLDLRRGDPFNVITSGHAPRARDEIVVGARAAESLDVGIGDHVSVALADGSLGAYTVVGTGVHPNDFDGYRDQITVLGDSTDPFLISDEAPGLGVLVRFRDGADADAVTERYRSEGANTGSNVAPPRAVANLEEVRGFPVVLAIMLGFLGTAFLLHALAVWARRRGLELAVLKTLGFTSRQIRTIAMWQATTIAVFSLAIGLPLGIGIGRIAWTTLADNLGVVTEHRLSTWPVLLGVGVIGAAVALSLVAGRRATRLRPAVELSSRLLE